MSRPASDEPRAEALLTPPPEGRLRRAVFAFIGGFLAFLVVTPLGYYLRDDPYDERFAWRMFSNVRLHACSTELVETIVEGESAYERPRDLTKLVHYSWIQMLSRNRRAVVRALLEERCAVPSVAVARLVNACRAPDGASLPPLEYRLDCATGALAEPAPPEAPPAPEGAR